MNKESSLKKNTFILTVGTFLNKGLQFVVIPFFSRWLSTEEYGEFDLLYTYVSLMIPLISLATQEAMFRFSVDANDEKEKYTNITNTFFINIVNFLIAGIVVWSMRKQIGEDIYIIFIIYLFLELIAVYLRGVLRAIKRLEIYSISMIISTIFMAIFVTIFVRFMDMGLKGILLGYEIGTLAGDISICLAIKFQTMLEIRSINLSKCVQLIRYSAPLIPNDVAWWVMNASDRKIINIFCFIIFNIYICRNFKKKQNGII